MSVTQNKTTAQMQLPNWTDVLDSALSLPLSVANGGTGGNNAATAKSNLSLDKVSNLPASDFFTSLSNSGNKIALTIGGTSKSLTPAFSSLSMAAQQVIASSCSSAVDDAVKVVSIANFALTIGYTVKIFFLHGNTAVSWTLCLNGTTYSPKIYRDGTKLTPCATIKAGAVLSFIYDGTDMLIINTQAEELQNALFDHNIPRLVPKDITSYVTDGSLWDRIAGTNGYTLHEDIFVGDYINMSRAISAYERTGHYQTTGSKYATIAGLDTMMNNGDQGSGIDYHHAVMVAGQGFGGSQHFGRSRMNATSTTEGGYKASEMNTLVLGDVVSAGSTADDATINQQLYAEFGAHLKTTRELVSNAINATGYNRFGSAAGCANSFEWISAQAILMSETECYGSIAWSSSGYDTGNANRQLPLFAFSKQAQNNRSAYYWLKDIASSANFCFSDYHGTSGYNVASGASRFVRPRFVIA